VKKQDLAACGQLKHSTLLVGSGQCGLKSSVT